MTTIFIKRSILDIWQGSEYASAFTGLIWNFQMARLQMCI